MRCLVPLLIISWAVAVEQGDSALLVRQVQELDALSRIIQREYALPVSRQDIWSGALAGMVSGLDGASRYLDVEEIAHHAGMQAGRGVGYGFDWKTDPSGANLEITRIIPGSPAEQANLAPGDRILALDGQTIAGMGPRAIRRHLIRGNSLLTLALHHPDGSSSEQSLERAPLEDDGVPASRMVTEDIGLLRIARFRDGRDADSSPTVAAFRRRIDSLRQNHMRGLILDLRGNGGGSVVAAVAIADAFLTAGHQEPRIIVEQVSRNPARNHRFIARSDNTLPNWPLVVLIDRHSASSAEIVAAALKDHGRATVIGELSYGKTTIQELFVLDSGAALLLTVAHFRSPAGSLDHRGIEPQVRVSLDPLLRWRLHRREQLRERGADLPADLADLQDPAVELATAMLRAAIIHSHR